MAGTVFYPHKAQEVISSDVPSLLPCWSLQPAVLFTITTVNGSTTGLRVSTLAQAQTRLWEPS